MGSCKRSVDYLVMVFLNKRSNLRPGSPSSHFVWKTRGRERRIYLLYASSARSPESGLLSDWSENKRSFGALHPSVKQHIWLPEQLDRFCYLMVTFVSSWQKSRDDTEEKTLTAEMRTSCYLLRPVRISAISSPMLSCSRGQNCCLWFPIDYNFVKLCKKLLIDDFKPACLRTGKPCGLENHERLFAAESIPILLTTSSKIQNSVVPPLFSMN